VVDPPGNLRVRARGVLWPSAGNFAVRPRGDSVAAYGEFRVAAVRCAAPQEGLPIVNGKRAGSSTSTELVDIEWVAKHLGVTVRHVRRLVAERRIPIVKWGHLVRFDPQEIEAWIDDQRRPPSQ